MLPVGDPLLALVGAMLRYSMAAAGGASALYCCLKRDMMLLLASDIVAVAVAERWFIRY